MTGFDRFCNWIADLLGHGFDPNADALPAWPDEKKKTAAVKSKQAVNERVFLMDKERSEYGFVGFEFEKPGKGNAKEVELSERDMGEMMEYAKGQKLTNEQLAAYVKKRKSDGATLPEIALETGYSVSYIQKVSAALSRADDEIF